MPDLPPVPRVPQVPPRDIAAAFACAATRVSGMRLELRWFSSVESTMDVVEEEARSGAAEGLVAIAEEQTRGRGRRGRVWSSPPGAGLYLSCLLRPRRDARAAPLSLLTLAAGVAVRAAVMRAAAIGCELKWPNDLMVGPRKLAGILAEGIALGTDQECVVVGIGINVLRAAHSDDIDARATSLQAEAGRVVDRGAVLEETLVCVSERYEQLCRGNTDDILREWRNAAPSARGAHVLWQADAGQRHGTAMGIDDGGALLVLTADGIERIVGGELTWL